MPDHGLPVWSVLFHPHDPDVILVGYENCEIYRSDDAGERWTRLPVCVRFPEITTAPGANPAKRVLMLDASASQPDHLYGAIEVGGTIRSTDGGEHWENLSHGQYVNDDMVDMHGVLTSRWRPETVFGIARAGMFRSNDGGDHWKHVPLEPLNPKGYIYCRDIREVPGNPRHLWVAAGAGFQSDAGTLLHSRDGGDNWGRVDIGAPVPHTMFKIAFDERQPARMSAATNGGKVYIEPRRRRNLDHSCAAARRQAGLRARPRLRRSNNPGRNQKHGQRFWSGKRLRCGRPGRRSAPTSRASTWRSRCHRRPSRRSSRRGRTIWSCAFVAKSSTMTG